MLHHIKILSSFLTYDVHFYVFFVCQVYDKPVFTNNLTGPEQVMEGQHAHYECRVVPVGDPNMRFEWYCNGVELKMGESEKLILLKLNL